MSSRRPQIVLIAFAVASWIGAVIELGAATGCGADQCLEQGINCRDATWADHAQRGASYCEGERCFTLETQNTSVTALESTRRQ